MRARVPDLLRQRGQRDQRKQDLLLASQLARGQVIASVNDLSGRADRVARRVLQVRLWLSSPLGLAAGGAAAALVLGVARRRARSLRLLRWGWLAWRLWRGAAPALARYRNAG